MALFIFLPVTKAISAYDISDKYISNNSLEGDKYVSNNALTGDIYKADKDFEASTYGEAETFEDFASGINISSKDYGTKAFVNKVLKDYWNKGVEVKLESTDTDEKGNVIKYPDGVLPLKTLLVDKAKEYGITKEGAKEISSSFGFSPAWVDAEEYKDVWYSLDDKDPTGN